MDTVGGGDGRKGVHPINDLLGRTVFPHPEIPKVRETLLVVDAQPCYGAPTGLIAAAVAEVVRGAGFDPSMICGADVHLAEKECDRLAPGAVLLLISEAPIGGLSLVDALARWEAPAALCEGLHRRHVPVIAVTVGAPAASLAACLAEGAIGPFGPDDLDLALRGLQDVVVERQAAGIHRDRLLRAYFDQSNLSTNYRALMTMTSAERRILNAMMQGWSPSDIATSLVVSLSTVRSHIRSILIKLDVSSQLAAVAMGYGAYTGRAPFDE